MKHKSVDYKLSAVMYYLNHEDRYDNTCKIFNCKKSSLKRWIHKYKDHLIILDNAGSHNNELIKNAIIKSGNHYLFAVPYTPKTDAIEQYFNQVKIYLKKDRNVSNF